uniref:Uncharacterized protein n=1 Tax=Ciona intestinalis TaxID=7719 RepID=H2XKV5_CIOIN
MSIISFFFNLMPPLLNTLSTWFHDVWLAVKHHPRKDIIVDVRSDCLPSTEVCWKSSMTNNGLFVTS